MIKEIDILVKLAIHLIDRYDSSIVLVPTDYCDGVDDRIVHKQILSEVKRTGRNKIFSLERIYSDKELKGIIACFDIAIGVRYHFSVFSLAEFVPSIGLASGEYQMSKLRGVYGLLGISEFFIDEDMENVDFRTVREKTDTLFQKREVVVETLRNNSRSIEISSKAIVEKILKDIE